MTRLVTLGGKRIQTADLLRRNKVLFLRMLCPLPCLAAVAACGLSGVPEVPVAKQWTETINNFSMIPVYPMRENVYVGDMRLTVLPETQDLGQLSYRNLGHLDLGEKLNDYYTNRPSLPKDATAPQNTQKPETPWPQPSSTASIFLTKADPTNTHRPRLAALPGVKVATVAQGTLAAQIPVSGIGNVGGAAAARGSRLLDISLSGVEEIEAPADWVVLAAFEAHCKKEVNNALSNRSYRFSLGQLIQPSGYDTDGNPQFADEMLQASRPQVVIVTRVLYARSIDFTFKTDQGYSADIAAVLGALENLQGVSTALAQMQRKTDDGAAAPAAEADIAAFETELASLVAGLRSTVSASAAPGVVLSTVFVDARGITLRDVFERPMAFAAQAVGFDLDLGGSANGCFVKAAPAHPNAVR
ncbi:MAG: hypothetical protein ACFCUT_03250 [Kiloniellaceae bacterium]